MYKRYIGVYFWWYSCGSGLEYYKDWGGEVKKVWGFIIVFEIRRIYEVLSVIGMFILIGVFGIILKKVKIWYGKLDLFDYY